VFPGRDPDKDALPFRNDLVDVDGDFRNGDLDALPSEMPPV
jgi:hypothetical protein